MVHVFVVFALLQVAAWIRLLTLDHPAPNGGQWRVYARSMTDTAFLASVGGSLMCLVFAVTCLVRRSTCVAERVLWLLVGPAMMIATWMTWWYEALGVWV